MGIEFWICSGVLGEAVSSAKREPRGVCYKRRVSHFLGVVSKEPYYAATLDVGNPEELLVVESDLRFRVWAKSVYQRGHKVKREMSDSELAQVLDGAKGWLTSYLG
jgi:hypothetical protein